MREKSTILVLLWLQKNEKQISIGEIYCLSRCIPQFGIKEKG